MKIDEIKALIESFYSGETDLAEEQRLFDYFVGDNIDEELLDQREFFVQLSKRSVISVPKTLNSDISTLIDNLSERENQKVRRKKLRFSVWIGAAAASIALLFYVGQRFYYADRDLILGTTQNYPHSDPRQALQEVEKALVMVSSNFNKGLDQISVMSTNIDRSSQIVQNSFGSTKKIKK